ncbi:MAG TPA: hypothetical protein VFB66_07260 [Tepidisphaeraceae bacterium]|nr:hypothetical protein [Tepidisphaeraceae bacterium]
MYPTFFRIFTLFCLSFLPAVPTNAIAASEDSPPPPSPPRLIYPNGLALHPDGSLYVSDIGAHQVFRLDKQGKLTVVAGTGAQGFSGDGGPATAARLSSPADITFDGDGRLLVADTFNHRIRRIDRDGDITTIVGDGKSNFSRAETPALSTSLNNPQSIALAPDGTFFLADSYNHVVRKVFRDGTVSVFAGTEAGLAGDGGAAAKAQLNLPQAVAVAPDGSVYISDSANSRIRRVGPDGTIQTVAGSGPGSGEGGAGFGGDGGPADKAKLFSAADLKFNAPGQLYVSDTGNNRVRLIAHNVIITVAGAGEPGFSGDNAPARAAKLNTPQKLAPAPDGSVYVADRVNRRVRKIDPTGVITTVAGEAPGEGILVDPVILPTPTPE